MLALTQETQLLRLSQVSGAGVVTGRGVDGVWSVLLEGAEVPFVDAVVFGVRAAVPSAAVSTQSAARQQAALGSRRQSPDISHPALAFRRELRRTTRDPSPLGPAAPPPTLRSPGRGSAPRSRDGPPPGLAGRGRYQRESCGRGEKGILRRNHGKLPPKVTVV